MAGNRDLIIIHYSAQNFKTKSDEYWSNAAAFGNFRVHYHQWIILLNIRHAPDPVTLSNVEKLLKTDYGHMNENSVTDAIRMNLRQELDPVIEAYQLINENFLIKLLTAYNKKLQEFHKIALIARNKALIPPELTPEETDQKNIQAMHAVFNEFKKTQNDELLSWRYYDYLDEKGVMKFTGARRWQFMEEAKPVLKAVKSAGSSLRQIDAIIKSIDAGGEIEDLRLIAKKLAVKHFFNSVEKLPL